MIFSHRTDNLQTDGVSNLKINLILERLLAETKLVDHIQISKRPSTEGSMVSPHVLSITVLSASF